MEASLGWRAPTAEMPASVKAGDTYGLLRTFRRVRKPGEQQAYTLANTLMLANIIEHVTGKRLGEVIDAEIWNKMGAENDALLLLNAKGIPIAHGGMVTTLRDLARFGLLLSQPNNSILPRRFLNRLLEHAASAPSEHNQQPATHHSGYQWDAVMDVTACDQLWREVLKNVRGVSGARQKYNGPAGSSPVEDLAPVGSVRETLRSEDPSA